MSYDEILPGRLYQGSAPRGRVDQDVIVLCAQEWQPDRQTLGKRNARRDAVIRAPMDDRPLDAVTLARATAAADEAARHVREGRSVLVTCFMGWNRSGLVTGLTLYLLTGERGDRIVRHIQKRRANALRNRSFAEFLAALPAKPKASSSSSSTSAPLR